MNKKNKNIHTYNQDSTFLTVSDAVATGWPEPINFVADAYEIR